MSANCPALAALAHFIDPDGKQEKINIEDIAILSIGTGATTQPIEYKEMKNWSTISWGEHIPDVFMGGQIQIATDTCAQILNAVNPGSYLRLQFSLNEKFENPTNELSSRELLPAIKRKNKYINKEINEAMDDASKENIENLLEAASVFVNSKSKVIKEFIKDKDSIALMPQPVTS